MRQQAPFLPSATQVFSRNLQSHKKNRNETIKTEEAIVKNCENGFSARKRDMNLYDGLTLILVSDKQSFIGVLIKFYYYWCSEELYIMIAT